jgi:hypothetical protein
MAVAISVTSCSSGTADTTFAASSISTAVDVTSTLPPTTTVPATTTTVAVTTTAPPAPLEAKYPVVVTSGLSGEETQEITV